MSCKTTVHDSKGNHVKFARFVLLADLYIFTRLELTISSTYCPDLFFFCSMYSKIIIRLSFIVISRIIKVSVGFFSLNLRLR